MFRVWNAITSPNLPDKAWGWAEPAQEQTEMWFSPLKSPDLILIVPIHDFCCWGKWKSHPKSKNLRCSRVSPEGSWLWKLLLVWLPWSQGEQEGMFGGGSASQGFAECLICNTQALPGQAPPGFVGLASQPCSLCLGSCQVFHQDRTSHTPPWWLSRDLLAFPWVSKGGGRLWEKLDGERLSFPLLLLSRASWCRAFSRGF